MDPSAEPVHEHPPVARPSTALEAPDPAWSPAAAPITIAPSEEAQAISAIIAEVRTLLDRLGEL